MTPARRFWVAAHRWAGLTITLVLLVAGSTGTLLAFRDDINGVAAPAFSTAVPPVEGARMIDPLRLRELAEARSGERIAYVPLAQEPGKPVIFSVERGSDETKDPGYELSMNPYTGQEQARRVWGAISEGWHNLMPFILRLHFDLALGPWMGWVFGIAALIWTLDCFVGAYVTLPVRQKGPRPATSSWWARWRPAWTVRRKTKAYKLNMDLHRAGGLWLWALLFVFAWSSVGLNLGSVHSPVMRALFAFREEVNIPELAVPAPVPAAAWSGALARGRALMSDELRSRGFTLRAEGGLYHDAATGAFHYSVRSSADGEYPNTAVTFSARDGRALAFRSTADERAGDFITRWMVDLHLAGVWGRTWDIIVAVVGIGVVTLSITGVVIWWKKRKARVAGRRKRGAQAPQAQSSPKAEPLVAE